MIFRWTFLISIILEESWAGKVKASIICLVRFSIKLIGRLYSVITTNINQINFISKVLVITEQSRAYKHSFLGSLKIPKCRRYLKHKFLFLFRFGTKSYQEKQVLIMWYRKSLWIKIFLPHIAYTYINNTPKSILKSLRWCSLGFLTQIMCKTKRLDSSQ